MITHAPDHKNVRTIALLGFAGAAALDITGPYEVFAAASQLNPDHMAPAYRIVLLADQAGPFPTVSGLSMVADSSWFDCTEAIDTLIVAGGPDTTPLVGNAKLLAWLRTMADRTRRIGSVCTGAFALAAAGLLTERRATTHWKAAEHLAKAYPRVKVEPDAIYIKDGNIYTSAGVTAGMDLALALVEEDMGRHVALDVARMLVLFLKRPGGQSQFSSRLQAQTTEKTRLAPLLSWLNENYRRPLTVEDMARQAAMSQRNFARVFAAETASSPANYLERIRLEHTVSLLESTGISLEAAARECGFTGCEQLRRAFQRHRGITPREHRERFRTSGSTD